MRDPRVVAVLDRLHREARGDWIRILRQAPNVLRGVLERRSFATLLSPAQMRDVYIPVSPQQGRLLYTLARATGASRLVEFGASFGLSTVYLASAARDTGGRLISTEIEPGKVAAARGNLDEAGLAEVAEIREGDALDTLADLEAPVDLVFLDGWKDLYEPVLDLLEPKLRQGSLVVADNVDFPDLRRYVARMQASDGSYVSTTLSASGRMEVSVFVGRP
ncbi:MAG: class I SAM-dependent methyltransferase [Acidimicrobiales bacterium]|nr:class I SAM-dependent methyltransferase [Acidimicrobiales bacterium]